MLAVGEATVGGDGWESNPPRTPQQRPANGLEDRGSRVRNRLSTSTGVRFLARPFRGRPPSSAVVHHVGCQLGCQRPEETEGHLIPRFRVRLPERAPYCAVDSPLRPTHWRIQASVGTHRLLAVHLTAHVTARNNPLDHALRHVPHIVRGDLVRRHESAGSPSGASAITVSPSALQRVFDRVFSQHCTAFRPAGCRPLWTQLEPAFVQPPFNDCPRQPHRNRAGGRGE